MESPWGLSSESPQVATIAGTCMLEPALSAVSCPNGDHEICRELGPRLNKEGLLFVGIDVIGDFLTEINVTSPTCMREIDRAKDTKIAEQLIACIEREVSESRGR